MTGELAAHERQVPRAAPAPATCGGGVLDEKVVRDMWTLRRAGAVRDCAMGASYRAGASWCLWGADGRRSLVADGREPPRMADLSFLRLGAEQITCMVAAGADTLVAGTDGGRLLRVDLRAGRAADVQLGPHAVDYVWHDEATGLVALSCADATMYHLGAWGAAPARYPLQLPAGITCASLSGDRQFLCVADRTHMHFYRWAVRPTAFRSLAVCRAGDDDAITRVAWCPYDRMVLVCTSARVLCYDSREHWLSVVTRQQPRFVEWSPLGKLFMLGEHSYSTLLHLYEHNNRGHWAPLGCTDIAHKFGITHVTHMAVMKTRLHLLYRGRCESFCLE